MSTWLWTRKNIPIYSIHVNENIFEIPIDVKVYSLTKMYILLHHQGCHVVFHDSNVNNIMFNTLGTTKILEIKKFLQSYEGCQMYWMVWGYTIIKDTNEKWQWMPKKKKLWFQTKVNPTWWQKMVQIKK